MPAKQTKDEFIKKALIIHNNLYNYDEINYVNSKEKIGIICPQHGKFFQTPNSHLNGNKCPNCSKRYKKTTSEFISECVNIHGNLYDYSLVEYKNNKQKITIICKEHNNQITLYARSHLSGIGCNKCKIKKYIPIFEKIHNNFYNYDKAEYIDHKSEIIITCPIHGDFLQNPFYHLDGCGCTKCNVNISKGELKIKTFLELNNIKFIHQHRFENCKNNYKLPFDFFLPDLNICIEFDGLQHFYVIDFFGGNKTFERQIKNDEIKNNYCIDNNINLIRIKFDNINNISNILSKVLYGKE